MSYYQDDENNRIRRKKISSNNSTNRPTRENVNYREQNNSKTINRSSSLQKSRDINPKSTRSNSTSRNSNISRNSSGNNRKTKRIVKRKKKNLIKVGKVLMVTFLISLILLSTVGSVFVFAALKDTPKINNGILLTKYISSDVATSDEIPKYLKDAVVSIEDERFYRHKGVDYISLARSLVHNLTSDTTQGGSTIEMQISKNLLTNDDKTMKRKVKDMYYALHMNKTMTKDEILVTYLNNIYLGRSSYGVKKGAKEYFGKEISDLSLAQCAMLAGITNNPARYTKQEEAKKRQETILYKMNELGYITNEQYKQAIKEPVSFIE